MSDIHVTGIAQVNIRCQFKTIPGVTHITLSHDPYYRGRQLTGVIKFFGGIGGNEFTIGDDEIIGCKLKIQKGVLELFSVEIFDEISQAINKGMVTLIKMIKASGYVPDPFLIGDNMIFVFEFMNDEFDYAIFNALHNPDLNEFNEMFSDALSMSEEYCGECQRVCVTVFENKEKTYEELFFDANKATEWFIERGFA